MEANQDMLRALKDEFPGVADDVVETALEASGGDRAMALSILREVAPGGAMAGADTGGATQREAGTRDDALKRLREQFSAILPDVIESVLNASDGDEAGAFSILCDMVAEAPDAIDPVEAETKFLRSVHETERAELESAEHRRPHKERKGVTLSLQDFDSLAVTDYNAWHKHDTTLASKLKVERLMQRYPWLERGVATDILIQEDGDERRAELQILAVYPCDDPRMFTPVAPTNSSAGEAGEASAARGGESARPAGFHDTGAAFVRAQFGDTGVVSSVGSVDNSAKLRKNEKKLQDSYERFRSTLELAQRSRSKQAYHDASEKKRVYDELFEEHLALLAQDRSFQESTSLDLHGYSLDSAVRLVVLKLDWEEEVASKFSERRRLSFITGRGSSTGGMVKIRPAVSKILNDRGYAATLDNAGGALNIIIK